MSLQPSPRPWSFLAPLRAVLWAASSAALLVSCGGSGNGTSGDGPGADARAQALRAGGSAEAVGAEPGVGGDGGTVYGESLYTEAGKLIRTDESLVALGNEMFGDRVSLYNGGLEFVQTDVSVPGNGRVPVGVARKHGAPVNQFTVNRWGQTAGHFGDWDLDIPRLHGVFANTTGWTVGAAPVDQANRRCSQFGAPSTVNADQTSYVVGNTGALFTPGEYWHGSFLYVPGSGSQELLSRVAGPTPGDAPYPVTTRDRWLLKCLPSLRNGQGEGFIAIAPDGTQYRFDWMVSRPYARLVKGTNGVVDRGPGGGATGAPESDGTKKPVSRMMGYFLDRKEVWILPTEVVDRHGNKVTYTWSAANPWQLLSIQDAVPAANPRVVNFTYLPNSYLIQGVTVGSRVWSYSYRNTDGGAVLASVQLPDSSQWTFSLDALTYGGELVNASQSGCDGSNNLNQTVFTGTMTHPSGAVGSFSIQGTAHGRSLVQLDCRMTEAGDPASAYPLYPMHVDRFSIVAKSISGPGLPVDAGGQPTTRWAYAYGPSNASFAPCDNCPVTKTVTVTDPDGDLTRYTFGNRFRVTEGQLLSEEVVDHSTGAVVRRTDYTYKSPDLGWLPYPDPVGVSIQKRGNGELASRHVPTQQKVITQQGVTFVWGVNAFDQFAKPVSISRWSSLGFQRIEDYWVQTASGLQLGYYNHLDKWVLGLTEVRKLQGGIEIERNQYDPANADLLKTWSFGQLKQTFSYHGDGTLATKADGAGKTTAFSNYKRGLAQHVAYADATTESAVVDDHGQVLSVTNAANTTTGYAYDGVGRLRQVSYPTGDDVPYAPTVTNYEQRWNSEFGLGPGHWVQTVTKGEATTQRVLDAQWRPLLTTTWDNRYVNDTRRVVVNRYDADGRKTFESYPQRAAASVGDALPGTSSRYDALGRIVQQVQTGAGATTTEYLPAFQRRVTNPRGFATTHAFQAFDEPTESTLSFAWLPEGVTVGISRDQFGKATSITRQGGGKSATRSYVYDAWQRLCKTIEPEVGATVQQLDDADNIAWRASGLSLPATASCDQAAVPADRKVSFGHDARNRLTSTSHGDGSPSITRSYTPDGLLAQIGTQGGGLSPITWTYSYNNRRLLTREQYTWWGPPANASDGWLFRWAIDTHGNVASLDDGWYPIAYAPNALGQPTQVGGYVSGVTYHPNGAVAGYTLGNGVTRSVSQNLRGLPEMWRDSGPAGLVMQERYAYDANGNVASITDERDPGGNRSMSWYDGLDRLRQANGPWGGGSFDYDALDNLTASTVGGRTLTHNFDANNRLISLTGSQNIGIGYDANGNIASRGGQNYAFDVGNRMSSAQGKASYVYDGHGRRNLVWFSSGDYMHQAYTHDGKLRLAWRLSEGGRRHVYLGDQVVAEHDANGITYQHTDALGSPVARTNSAGAVVSWTRYQPYGATVAGTTNPATIGFTGHVNDGDTGLVYMQQRYYDPIAGRFLSVDPVTTDAKTGDSFSRYAYGHNNPYKYVDPDGRFGFLAFLATPPGLAVAAVAVVGHYVLPGREAREQSLGSLIRSESSSGGKPSTLTPGPNAGDSIPARGPGRDFTPGERQQVNDIGNATGCHTCGATSPGTKSDNWIPDHQPANSQNGDGGQQRLYPHCLSCSRTQGGQARAEQSRGKAPEPKKEEPKTEK